MNKIEVLPGSVVDLDTLFAIVREQNPSARHGIIIVFDPDGGVHTHYRCNSQEMAYASVRLAHLSQED